MRMQPPWEMAIAMVAVVAAAQQCLPAVVDRRY
jgi:hypothetical protein